MKRCLKCNLEVDSVRKTCPLCLSVLEVKDDKVYEKKFPTPEFLPQRRNIILKILSFLSVISIFASIIINLMTYEQGQRMWSIIVIFNIAYFWILIKSTFTRKGNIPRRLVIQTLAISLLVYVIDYFTGYTKWSVNYVFPFITMASLLSIISLSIGSRTRYKQYIMQILTAVFLGVIPLVLWLFNIVDIVWPSLSSASLSFVTIIGMIIFADKDTNEEFKKRFHI